MTSTAERPTGVVVDGLDLNNIEATGLVWEFKSIDGWINGPGVNVDQTQRVVDHGQFFQRGHRTGKTLSIVGYIKGARALVAEGIDRLNAVLADGGLGLFQFTDVNLGLRWTYVQLLGAPLIPWDGSPTVKYQLQLLAPDPYKYGATSSASTGFGAAPVGAGLVFNLFPSPSTLDFGAQGTTGTVTISNPGTAESSVKFTVVGPTPSGGFVITDESTGKTITFLGAVPSGSVLVLDGSDGSVVIDGSADRLGDTIVQAWPQIPAGGSRDFLFTPLGGSTAALLTAETTATYW